MSKSTKESRDADYVSRKAAVELKYADWIRRWARGESGEDIAKSLRVPNREVSDQIYRLRVAYGLFQHEERLWARFGEWRDIWGQGGTISDICNATGLSSGNVGVQVAHYRHSKGWFAFEKNDPRRTAVCPATAEEAAIQYRKWLDLWAQGKSIKEVASTLGREYGTVASMIRELRERFGFFKPHVEQSPQQRFIEWTRLWDEQISIPEMAKRLGVKLRSLTTTITRMRRRHGMFPVRVKRSAVRQPAKPRRPSLGKTNDYELAWLVVVHGSPLQEWQSIAKAYFVWADRNRRSLPQRLAAVGRFLDYYVPKHGFADPKQLFLLNKREGLPTLLGKKKTATFDIDAEHGRDASNFVSDFLDWALENDDRFSEDDGDGKRETLPGLANPLGHVSKGGLVSPSSSVRAPLPYKYIVELRDMLAAGPNFSDWKWAHSINRRSGVATGSWFEVTKGIVERWKGDPDFVWETREVHVTEEYGPTEGSEDAPLSKKRKASGGTRTAYYAWSPVSAVALLLKLFLPLRQYQVRMLDDGSADIERCDIVEHPAGSDGKPNFDIRWGSNPKRERMLVALKPADRARVTGMQGVFRKTNETITQQITTGLYINTNKTADIDREWNRRGYVIHWEHRDVLRWLLKLRNWQEKYNPLVRPALWAEMQSKHHGQKAGAHIFLQAPPACFLFRDAAAKKDPADRVFPIQDGSIVAIWVSLLEAFENRLWVDGVRTQSGGRVELIKDREASITVTHFPLHSLRVSLLSSLAFEGGVSLRTLMGLAGHSRILMAIYYQKLGSVMTSRELEEGFHRALAQGEKRVETFLMQKTLDQVAQLVVAVDEQSLGEALPVDPGERTPVGWLKVGGGYCLMGGNTSYNHENRGVGGCFNGGQIIAGKVAAPIHGPVPARNCIGGKCRWFVTRPEFLPELHARARNLFFHLTEIQGRAEGYDAQLKALRVEKLYAQREDRPFMRRADESRIDRLSEKAHAELDALLTNIVNTLALIDRCAKMISQEKDGELGQELIAQGCFEDVRVAIQTTDSELLILSGVCADAALFEELQSDLGAAVERRSQILDLYFLRRLDRPIMATLTRENQLKLGNRIIADMSAAAESLYPLRGLEMACKLIESDAVSPDTPPTIDTAMQSAVLAVAGMQIHGLLEHPSTPLRIK